MAKVILTAKVKDGTSWESAFRTHGEMFRKAGLGTINYTIEDHNLVVMCTDVDDVDAYKAFVASDETRAAMKNDGVKRKSVKLHVLDKELSN